MAFDTAVAQQLQISEPAMIWTTSQALSCCDGGETVGQQLMWPPLPEQGMSSFVAAPPRLDGANLMSAAAAAAAAAADKRAPNAASPPRGHSPPPRLGSPGLVQVRRVVGHKQRKRRVLHVS